MGLKLGLRQGLKFKLGLNTRKKTYVNTGAVAEDGTEAGPGAEDCLGLKLG